MKILVAEDQSSILQNLKSILEKEGFEVLAASDGSKAFELWREHQPDLVCLDIMMPELDGYEVCRRIRSEDSQVPVLFLSAKSEEIDVVVGLELGADDFIRKPFGKHELLARIRVALRGRVKSTKQNPQEASFSFGHWTVMADELRIVSAEASVDVSPRELKIIHYFYTNAGKVVSRDALLDACWGIDFFPDSRSLDQQISRLRKKIELDASEPKLIETVRGAGYRYKGGDFQEGGRG